MFLKHHQLCIKADESSPINMETANISNVPNTAGNDSTPLERHSTTEIQITTPVRQRGTSRLTLVASTPVARPSNSEASKEFNDEDCEGSGDEELLCTPLYAWILKEKDDNQSSKRSKVPQALPLQKVLKRKAMEMENQTQPVYYEESDGEVVVLMDGVLTKVGKPSAPASSGKIYSTAQNCPITVKWLLENFESMPGQSLPRSFVYDQYVHHCGLHKIESVNAASFGKLIRSVFLGLKTRRLGTRGNSKYHYYGIKIKESSFLLPILNSIRAEQDLLNDTVNGRIRKRVRRTQSVYTGKHVKGLAIDKKIDTIENLGCPVYQYPEIKVIISDTLPDGLVESMLTSFEDIYKRHCQKLVNFFLEFKLVDALAEISNFWRLSLTFKRKGLEDYSTALSKTNMFKVLSMEVVDVFIARMDLYMYQHIIDILTPSVLRPLPLQMLQAVDNMIQDILSILSVALNGFPKRTAHTKLRCLTAFVRVWKQYSKMSQLSEFIELTLDNEYSIAALRQNIKAIRLAHVCQRAAIDVESETMPFETVFKMMASFSRVLDQEQSLQLWCDWAHHQLMKIAEPAMDSVEEIERVTADMHSTWLILSNLVVNAIREMSGSDSSLFVPLLQWCGELMQYFRQRILDDIKMVMPITRFYVALLDEDMSVSFMDKHKAKALSVSIQPTSSADVDETLFIPDPDQILDDITKADETQIAEAEPTELATSISLAEKHQAVKIEFLQMEQDRNDC